MKKSKFISIVLSIVIMLSAITTMRVNAQSKQTVKVLAVGDNLIHKRVIQSGIKEDGSMDYSDIYRYFARYNEDYDLRVINQETLFVEDKRDFSGYPRFGGPKEIGNAVLDAGFNAITTATNHVLDKGLKGLEYSHCFWTNWGIDPVGTYTNNQYYDMDTGEYVDYRAVFFNKNGIRVGMLNYTYGTNGMTIPEEYSWMVSMLDDKDRIAEEMKYVKSKCDALIVFPHWGIEYQYKPSTEQKEWAQFFADNGADVIIGTHPHVIEPLEYIETEDGRQVPCYYSLGNFISNQDEVPRMLGAVALFTIKKTGDKVEITDVKVTPTITHISKYSEEFYAESLYDYTEKEASQHRMRRIKGDAFSIENLWKLWYSVFTEEQTAALHNM